MTVVSPNIDYSSIGTGFSTELKRASGIGLRFGTNATHNLIQSVDGAGAQAPLWINGYSTNNIEVGGNSGLTTTITGGSGFGNDVLRIRRAGSGLNFGSSAGHGNIESTGNLNLSSSTEINIGINALPRINLIAQQMYSALGTGYSFSFGNERTAIRFGDSIAGGFGKVPYLMQVVSNNLTVASDLKINPFGGNVGIGLVETYTVFPSARLHVKGDSDSAGSAFRVDSLTNNSRFEVLNDNTINMNMKSGKNFTFTGEDSTSLFRILRGGDGVYFNVVSSTLQIVHTSNTATSNIAIVQGNHIDAKIDIGRKASGIVSVQHKSIWAPTITDLGFLVGTDADSGGYGLNIFGGTQYIIMQGKYGASDTRDIRIQPFGSNIMIGADLAPTSILDISSTNGYSQLRLRTQYTPTSTADANGAIGDICFDNNYMYYKTTEGWKRSGLSTF